MYGIPVVIKKESTVDKKTVTLIISQIKAQILIVMKFDISVQCSSNLWKLFCISTLKTFVNYNTLSETFKTSRAILNINFVRFCVLISLVTCKAYLFKWWNQIFQTLTILKYRRIKSLPFKTTFNLEVQIFRKHHVIYWRKWNFRL